MAKIRTVLGDKDPAEMGHILPHEHTFPHLLAAKSDHASVFDREKAVEEGAAKLRAVNTEQGVSGLVDCAPYDLGRDMGLLMGLSRASGWDIVAATGIFGVWGYPAYWEGQGDAAIEEFFTREIEEGAVDEGVRCGVIKVGTRLRPHEKPPAPVSSGELLLSDQDRRVLKAAARVQGKIGVPITTHTDRRDWRLGNVGLEQIETLTGAGADPEKCIIGHASHTSNLGYIVEVLERGCYVAFDTIGIEIVVKDRTKAAMVIGLIGLGYEKQILLSHDLHVQEVGRVPESGPNAGLKYAPDYGYIQRVFVPWLREAGVTEEAIRQVTVENPKRALAW